MLFLWHYNALCLCILVGPRLLLPSTAAHDATYYAVPPVHGNKVRLRFEATEEWGVAGDGVHDDTEGMRRLLTMELTRHAYNHNTDALVVERHIVIPPNATVLTLPLNLSSHTILQVDGCLQALSTRAGQAQWPILPPLPLYNTSEDTNGGFLVNQYQSFLYARNATNVRITGTGTIDAGGPLWWKQYRNYSVPGSTSEDEHNMLQAFNNDMPDPTRLAGRPNLLQFVNCSHIEIDSVTMKDAPFWTLHPILCHHVHIHHMKIRAPLYSPNVDGIDPDACKHVLIEYNDVSCGDDHIAIKAGVCGVAPQYRTDCRTAPPEFRNGAYATEHVTVRYNILRTGMGIALGSEMSGSLRNIHIYGNAIGVCDFGHDPMTGCGWGPALHIKTTITRTGVIENVLWEKNTIYNTSMALLVETGYQTSSHQEVPPDYPPVTQVRNISFVNNIAVGESTGVAFGCDPRDPCHNITVVNLTIAKADSSFRYTCQYVDSFDVDNTQPPGLDECMAQSMDPPTLVTTTRSSWSATRTKKIDRGGAASTTSYE